MPIPVSKSLTPLVFDTLPALKVRHYSGKAALGNTYTLARLYALGSCLALSLCVFEEAPAEESHVAFCVAGKTGAFLKFCLTKSTAELTLCGAPQTEVLQTPKPERFTGQDEQGWYWGGSLLLPEAALQALGLGLAVGEEFGANLIRYRSDETVFGTAFPAEEDAFSPACFGLFQVVDY